MKSAKMTSPSPDLTLIPAFDILKLLVAVKVKRKTNEPMIPATNVP